MLSIILLGVLAAAALLAAAASRRGVSPWWVFLPASLAGFLALVTSSDVSDCNGPDSANAIFGIAILVAVGLFAAAAFTALFDAVRFARAGEKRPAAARLVPLVAGVGLGFGTLVLWVVTIVSCLN